MFYNKSLRTRNSFATGIHISAACRLPRLERVYTPAVEGKEQAFVPSGWRVATSVALRRGDLHPHIRRPGGGGWSRRGDARPAFAEAADIPVHHHGDVIYTPARASPVLMTMMREARQSRREEGRLQLGLLTESQEAVSVPHSMMDGTSLFGADIVIPIPRASSSTSADRTCKGQRGAHGGSFTIRTTCRRQFAGPVVVTRSDGTPSCSWGGRARWPTGKPGRALRGHVADGSVDESNHEPQQEWTPLNALSALRSRLEVTTR
jgi:hypothetical protein